MRTKLKPLNRKKIRVEAIFCKYRTGVKGMILFKNVKLVGGDYVSNHVLIRKGSFIGLNLMTGDKVRMTVEVFRYRTKTKIDYGLKNPIKIRIVK